MNETTPSGPSRFDQAAEWVSANRPKWVRGLLMLLFAIVLEVVQFLVGLMALVQFVLLLVTGVPNEPLRRFGAALSVYAQEIVAFLTCASEKTPFPFGDWPQQPV